MREFFIQQLKQLKMLTGSNQYANIASIENRKEAQDALDLLLHSLINVCNTFNYIPDEQKKKILSSSIIEDQQFIENGSLNAKFVWKHLSAKSSLYFKEVSHQGKEESEDYKPVSFDELNPETKDLVKTFMAKLATDDGVIRSVPSVSQSEIDAIKKEDDIKVNGQKSASKGYHINDDLVIQKEKLFKSITERGLDKLDFRDLKKFEVDGRIITARNEEEAQEIYLEVYA